MKAARNAAGMTQKQLAERMGVKQKDISRWENGERTPTVDTFKKICEEIGASADEILELKIESRNNIGEKK